MRKPDLADALKRAAKVQRSKGTSEAMRTSDATSYSGKRAGKVMVAGYFDPEVSRQLRQIALDDDTTVQALMAEALNDLFAKRGSERIAEP